MDSTLVNSLAETYRDRTLRMTPSLMEELGLEKRSTRLDIEEFQLSCIPFDLSLSGANLLSFLSSQELSFFQGMAKGRTQRLNLRFQTPSSSKPISFFVRTDIVSFAKPAPDSPYCFIALKFREPPFALKEILVGYFKGSDEAEAYFATAHDEPVGIEAAASALGSPRLNGLREGLVAERLRVVELSPKRLKLFGEFDGTPPAAGEAFELEPEGVEESSTLRCTVRSLLPFAEVPGFFWLEADLLFCPWLHSRLLRLAPPSRAARREASD